MGSHTFRIPDVTDHPAVNGPVWSNGKRWFSESSAIDCFDSAQTCSSFQNNDGLSFGGPQAVEKEHDTETDRLKAGFTGEEFSFFGSICSGVYTTFQRSWGKDHERLCGWVN
jgi:hypothetical protein